MPNAARTRNRTLRKLCIRFHKTIRACRDQIKKELKTYVALYQRQHAGTLPSNMYIIYDYFLLAGDKSWYVPPAEVVTTKNVDSLFVTTVSNAPSTATPDVITRATGNSSSGSSSGGAPDPSTTKPAHPVVKKTTTTTPAPH